MERYAGDTWDIMKISPADEQIKVYCRVISDETSHQYPVCVNLANSCSVELFELKDQTAFEVFSKRDKIVNSPTRVNKENPVHVNEIVPCVENFSFDRIFGESDSIESIFKCLDLNLEYNHCVISINRSNLLTLKNGLIVHTLNLACEQGFLIDIGMANITLGQVQSVYKGYKRIENLVSGIRHLFDQEYFNPKRVKEDIYVTTFVLEKERIRTCVQFVDISQLSKYTETLGKILTNCNFIKDGLMQAKDSLVQMLTKTICFGGKIHIFGHIQPSLPFLNSNRVLLYYIDNIIQNRQKNRNAYTELLLKEVRKLQKVNTDVVKQQNELSTQVMLLKEQLKEESQIPKCSKILEAVEETNEEYNKTQDSQVLKENNKVSTELVDMYEKVCASLKACENRCQELKDRCIYAEKQKTDYQDKVKMLDVTVSNYASQVKKLESELRLERGISNDYESLVKKQQCEKQVLESSLESLSNTIKTNKISHSPNQDLDQIHTHYYEQISSLYQAFIAYDLAKSSHLEDIEFKYNNLVQKYNTRQSELMKAGKDLIDSYEHLLEEQDSALKSKIVKIQEENEEKSKKIQNLSEKIQNFNELTQKCEELNNILANTKKSCSDEYNKKLQENSHQLKLRLKAKLNSIKGEYVKELEELTDQIKTLESEKQKLVKKNNQLATQIAENQAKHEKFVKDLKGMNELQTKKLKEDIEALKIMNFGNTKKK